MEAITEIQHNLQYGMSKAGLNAEVKARVESVIAGFATLEKKRIANREKKEAKKTVAAATAAAAVTPTVVLVTTVPASVPGTKKKRGKKEKDEVYQAVADKKRAECNAVKDKQYCDHEISVHQKLLADEIKQNSAKVFQLHLHEMDMITKTREHALVLIRECQNMSADRREKAIQHVEQDAIHQKKEAETRHLNTALVLKKQEQLHKGHFEQEELMNTTQCDKKTQLTKAYNEKKNSAFSHAKFSHIVKFTKLDKNHFDGEKDAALNSIYTNATRYNGIPAQRARTHR